MSTFKKLKDLKLKSDLKLPNISAECIVKVNDHNNSFYQKTDLMQTINIGFLITIFCLAFENFSSIQLILSLLPTISFVTSFILLFLYKNLRLDLSYESIQEQHLVDNKTEIINDLSTEEYENTLINIRTKMLNINTKSIKLYEIAQKFWIIALISTLILYLCLKFKWV